MVVSVSYKVSEKYDPIRKEIGLRVSISGFKAFNGTRIRFSGFPSQDQTISKAGSLTFTAIGHPGNNTLEVIDPKTSRILQLISSLNGKVFEQSEKGEEIIITHKSKSAVIELKKVTNLKNEYLRVVTSPKLLLFFGVDENNKPIYTKKVTEKGSIKVEITGPLTDAHEVKVLKGQMSTICSIKPPEP